MTIQKFNATQIQEQLTHTPHWKLDGDKIKREFVFESFMDAIDFINKIAPLADNADHHPEIFNVYNRVDLVLTTHDANGLTHKDFQLAKRIDSVV